MKSRRQKTEETCFAWKKKHVLGIKTQNGQTYWRHTCLPPPPFAPSQASGREAALVFGLAGRGLGYACKINRSSSQERGQAGWEQSGKFFHLGLFHVDASMFWYFYWSWTRCWHKQVKFLWQSQRWPWMVFKGSELFSLLLGRTGRPGLTTFIHRDDPA